MRLLCPGKPRINWEASRARTARIFKKSVADECITQKLEIECVNKKLVVFIAEGIDEELSNDEIPQTPNDHCRKESCLIPFGFKWCPNSCAFDIVVTSLIHTLKKLSREQRLMFEQEVRLFHQMWFVSQQEFTDSGSAWQLVKQDLRQQLKNNTVNFVGVDAIWKEIFPNEPTDLTFCQSTITNYFTCGCTRKKSAPYTLSSLTILSSEGGHNSISHWFKNHYGTIPQTMCTLCESLVFKKRHIEHYPVLLFLNFGERGKSFPLNGEVDRVLQIKPNVVYELHAVGYGNNFHFISRFRHANGTNYKYDGMDGGKEHAVRCRPIPTYEKQFPYHPSGKSFTISFAMYIKKCL